MNLMSTEVRFWRIKTVPALKGLPEWIKQLLNNASTHLLIIYSFVTQVVVTFFVGAAIHHDISNNFHHLAEPFLMGTVALGVWYSSDSNYDKNIIQLNEYEIIIYNLSLICVYLSTGGVVNVMPFLYGKIQPVASQVNGFRTAILLGLTTCTILNILWYVET